MNVEYNDTFYTSSSIVRAAEIYLSHLPKGVTVLLSMGNSGCAIATAMLVLSKRKLWHIAFRKYAIEENISHSSVSGKRHILIDGPHKCVIVDDFISSGSTIRKVIESFKCMEPCTPKSRIVAILVNHRTGGMVEVNNIPTIFCKMPKTR